MEHNKLLEPPTHMRSAEADPEKTDTDALDRRTALRLIGSLFGTALVAGCGGGGSSAGSLSSTGTTTTGVPATTATTIGTTTGAVGAVTPEGEIGPYFADDSAAGFNRSNILSNLDGTNTQTGIPLTLKLYVWDSENSFAAVSGAQVDIWHCNAQGVYSDESSEGTTGQTWLRGYQLTDATGMVTFKTVIPGWYQGRATHIHLRVRSKYSEASSTSDGTNTTQLFFSQTVLDYIYTNIAPYNIQGKDTTTNIADRVYTQQTKGEMLLTLTGDYTNGYAATFAINLPITSE